MNFYDVIFAQQKTKADSKYFGEISDAINVLAGTEKTYNPAEMGAAIIDAIPTEEVTDDIVSVTDAAAYPAKGLEFAIEPVQEGSGDPSPTNIRPISGWTAVNGKRTGVNVWDEEWKVGAFQSDTINSKNYIPVLPNTTYYCKCTSTTSGVSFYVALYDADKNVIKSMSYLGINSEFTTASNAYFMKFRMSAQYGTSYNHDISINYPATDTEYHAYTGTSIPITFPAAAGTVYGGKVDVVNGKLTVNYASVDLGTLNWTYINNGGTNVGFYTIISDMKQGLSYAPLLCDSYATGGIQWNNIVDKQIGVNATGTPLLGTQQVIIKDSVYSDATTFKTAMQGVQLVYKLITPVEYDIAPQQVQMLLGDNNVWCDTGDTTLEYKVDLGRYIEKLKASQTTPQLSLSRGAVSLEEPRDETAQNEDEAIREEKEDKAEDEGMIVEETKALPEDDE